MCYYYTHLCLLGDNKYVSPDFTPLASVTQIPTAIFYLMTITIGVPTLCVYGCAQAHTLDNMNCQKCIIRATGGELHSKTGEKLHALSVKDCGLCSKFRAYTVTTELATRASSAENGN